MAETNSATKPVVDDDKPVTEDDLRKLKYPDDEVETAPKAEDETTEGTETEEKAEETSEDDGQTASEETEEEEESTPPAFVKEFDYIKGDTPEEYAKNLESAYKNSSSEALRLKDELANRTAPPAVPTSEPETPDSDDLPFPTSPLELWAQQNLDERINQAYDGFKKVFPQVLETDNFTKFSQRVSVLSKTIMADEKRLASPEELYETAAYSLGWSKTSDPVDSKDKLNEALKNNAASGKPTSAAPGKAPIRPKISEAMMKMNRQMYPGKTDAEIIEELTPYLPTK